MRYFPLFLDLEGRRAVVVGGGEEALRKVRLLLKTGVRVELIARALPGELVGNAKVLLVNTPYHSDLIAGAAMVLSADDNLNERVSADAQRLGIPVNAVDDAALSTFIIPSIVDRDPVVVAIGTEGTAPVLGQNIRAKVDAMLPRNLGALALRAAGLRDWVADRVPHGNSRRAFWSSFFSGATAVPEETHDDVAQKMALDDAIYAHGKAKPGRVSLVGAGPGDPELLTLKAHRRLMEADVIVYDRLVSPGILEMARRDATRISVGKTPRGTHTPQDEINAILLREAQAGRDVVRLKGGDPYIFGRGGEEQSFLKRHGISVDVVPGITAALGCAASAGLPLTLRGRNQSITLMTAAGETGLAEQDWLGFAKSGQPLAIYMGREAAGSIAAKLMEYGLASSTIVHIVENGTLANERVLKCTIGNLWDTLNGAHVSGPAIIYVGLGEAKSGAEILPFPAREDLRETILRVVS
jgi:uroporphyrin-III C-methyltransferase/precorrin-2 dehydrogenase/sirohydrochlorin ferrochelatase